jgi:hypothetical protein
MIRNIYVYLIFIVCLNADDNLLAQKQNTLYVQNLIKIEENITKNFEKYILTEFKLPTIVDLIDDNYLGSNFSVENRMGVDIDFLSTTELKIKYLITKDEYRDSDKYITQLYNRDVYRDLTTVYFERESNLKVDFTKSYVEMKLESDEAKTIFLLLKDGNVINKECSSILVNVYCNNNQKTIRWYNATSQWIEYSKKEFNNGNITTSMGVSALMNEAKISDLAVGSYIFIKDISKYVKLVNLGSTIQILKVD